MYLKIMFLIVYFNLFADLILVCSKPEPNWRKCRTNENRKLIDCSNVGLTKILMDIYDSSWLNIRLGRNPFNCDCSMKFFLQDDRFPEYLKRTADLQEAVCATPTNYAGVKILNLADDTSFCENSDEEATDFTSFFKINARFVASLVLVFLLAVLTLATCVRKCKKEKFSYGDELMPANSTKENRLFLIFAKLFRRYSQKSSNALNQSMDSSECREDDDIIYENCS